MASIESDSELIERVLRDRACFYAATHEVRTLMAFDREHGQFLLIDEGWAGYRRIHHIWAHIELRDRKFVIHEDGTEDGLANSLTNAGIPSDRIVLAFHAPCLRTATDFAVA